MIRLLIFLFTGEWKCFDHKWKIIKEVIVNDTYTRGKWTRYYLQCEKCGDIKIKD